MSNIHKLTNADGAEKLVMTTPHPYDDFTALPTRRYMFVSEIEGRYYLIYEAIEDEAEDADGQIPWSATVKKASRDIAAGAKLPPFIEMPSDVQDIIWAYMDTAAKLSQYDMQRIINQLRGTGEQSACGKGPA